MSDDWTQQQLREIRRLAPDYGWQDKDGDVIRWINARAPACLAEYKRQAGKCPQRQEWPLGKTEKSAKGIRKAHSLD